MRKNINCIACAIFFNKFPAFCYDRKLGVAVLFPFVSQNMHSSKFNYIPVFIPFIFCYSQCSLFQYGLYDCLRRQKILRIRLLGSHAILTRSRSLSVAQRPFIETGAFCCRATDERKPE